LNKSWPCRLCNNGRAFLQLGGVDRLAACPHATLFGFVWARCTFGFSANLWKLHLVFHGVGL